MQETYRDFTGSIEFYVGEASHFDQLSLAHFFDDHSGRMERRRGMP